MASPRPRPPWLRVDAAVGLAEPVEDVGQEIRADAHAVVAHPDLGVAVAGALQADLDAAAGRGELDGVREQVPDHLLQAVGIAGDRPASGVEAQLEADLLAVGAGRMVSTAASIDLCQVDRAHLRAAACR